MPPTARLLATAMLAASPLAAPLGAQSPQPTAIQLSALATTVTLQNEARPGFGVEGQFRGQPKSTPGFSFGVGFQYSGHKAGSQNFNIRGLFVEPRRVIDVGRFDVQPYVALRLAALQLASDFAETSGGYAFGGGGGVAFLVSERVIIDGGLALIRQSFGDITFKNGGGTGSIEAIYGYAIKLGLTYGLGKS